MGFMGCGKINGVYVALKANGRFDPFSRSIVESGGSCVLREEETGYDVILP